MKEVDSQGEVNSQDYDQDQGETHSQGYDQSEINSQGYEQDDVYSQSYAQVEGYSQGYEQGDVYSQSYAQYYSQGYIQDDEMDSMSGSQLDYNSMGQIKFEVGDVFSGREESKLYTEGHVTDSAETSDFATELITRQHMIGTAGGTRLENEDWQTLRNGELLNGAIIDSYLNLIKNSSQKECSIKVYPISSFFYSAWISGGQRNPQSGPAKVKRWVRNINLFEYDIVLFPINNNNHWSIVAVDFKHLLVTYFDSLEYGHGAPSQLKANRYVQPVRDLIESEALKHLGMEKYFDRFKFSIQNEPDQLNGIDCGLFLCQFAKFYCRRQNSFDFSQSSMFEIRMHMTIELACDEIIYL